MLGYTSCAILWWAWLLAVVFSDDDSLKGCVNHPLSACPQVSRLSPCLCKRIEKDSTIICCNITSEYQLREGLSCATRAVSQNQPGMTLRERESITALHILNSTLEKLDVSQASFQRLIGMSVTQSNIPRIMGSFPSSIMCLNLSSNHLIEIDPLVFDHVPQLGYLDLSNNNLTHPPVLKFATFSKNHFFIDLSGNQNITCKQLYEVKTQKNSSVNLNFVHENETTCSVPSHFNWFNSVSVYSLPQLDSVYKMDMECPRSPDYQCRCSLERNVELSGEAKGMHNYVLVDCSSLGLTELPSILPPDTLSLNITNNSITHLNYLGTNSHYRSVMHIYADDNRIESITALEGSKFISNFISLSLRNNNIKVIPKYLLSNVFDRNNFIKIVNLGMNRLPCDCNTAQVLKVWLLANKEHIKDYDQLLCENFNEMKVVDLDQAKVCVYPRDWTDYIYYIITLEVVLFLLLISKVSYDYWVFKTTGSLPWPASKMPRLPCDWVFE